jgi:predicted secreted protein
MNAPKKPNAKAENVKTALVLAVIAAFFFAAVIVKRLWLM